MKVIIGNLRVMIDILPKNVWKIGYAVKENHLKGDLIGKDIPEYDVQTAFSILCFK